MIDMTPEQFVRYLVGHQVLSVPIIDGPAVPVGTEVELRLICVVEDRHNLAIPDAPLRLRVTDWAGPTAVEA